MNFRADGSLTITFERQQPVVFVLRVRRGMPVEHTGRPIQADRSLVLRLLFHGDQPHALPRSEVLVGTNRRRLRWAQQITVESEQVPFQNFCEKERQRLEVASVRAGLSI